MATCNSSNPNSEMLKKSLSKLSPALSSGVFVGITNVGDCVIGGFGELDTRASDLVAMKLYLMAERLRSAARRKAASM